MRIAYFAHVNGAGQSGVEHKIAAQVTAWGAAGRDVRTFIATRDAVAAWRGTVPGAHVRRYAGPVSRMRAMAELVRGVRRFRPDVIYVRWDLFYPPMLWFPGSAVLVAEINSDDVREYQLGTRLRAAYNARTRALLLRRARALVFVTPELARARSFERFRGQHHVITNGIELQAYPELPPPAPAGGPRLVFVGTAGQPWHGIDKVLRLAAARPGWSFDIVGFSDSGQPALANVTWHGPRPRAEVMNILARADLGIGTLALHRKGMTEACPLKVREYVAVGLPVLYAYADPDLAGLEGYTLRIANTEANVDDELERIDEFVARARGLRVPRACVAHLDVAAKEGQRLALFDAVAGS